MILLKIKLQKRIGKKYNKKPNFKKRIIKINDEKY